MSATAMHRGFTKSTLIKDILKISQFFVHTINVNHVQCYLFVPQSSSEHISQYKDGLELEGE